jgi:hypothetical protein
MERAWHPADGVPKKHLQLVEQSSPKETTVTHTTHLTVPEVAQACVDSIEAGRLLERVRVIELLKSEAGRDWVLHYWRGERTMFESIIALILKEESGVDT